MAIYSMTGYAQVRGQLNGAGGFTLSLKAVNHRFLDLHFRTPPDTSGLEMKLRRILKERLARGHVEVTLTIDRGGEQVFAVNRDLVAGYVQSFRTLAGEFGISAEPDLNLVLRLPGAMDNGTATDPALEAAVLGRIDEILANLNVMRAEEGRGMERELRERMARLQNATAEVEKLDRRCCMRIASDDVRRRNEVKGVLRSSLSFDLIQLSGKLYGV